MAGKSDPMLDTTRDHLANERTFLAWVRTSLGLIGLGFVLGRMGLFLRQIALAAEMAAPGNVSEARELIRQTHAGNEFIATGVVFLAVGTALVGWSGWLYQRTRRAIDAGRYEPAGASVAGLTGFLLVGGLAIIGLVIWRTFG
jgi:putative membrane protein